MNSYEPSFMDEVMFVVMPAFVFGVFVFLAMFFAILFAGRRLTSRIKLGFTGPSGALGIVQERYARGELSR